MSYYLESLLPEENHGNFDSFLQVLKLLSFDPSAEIFYRSQGYNSDSLYEYHMNVFIEQMLELELIDEFYSDLEKNERLTRDIVVHSERLIDMLTNDFDAIIKDGYLKPRDNKIVDKEILQHYIEVYVRKLTIVITLICQLNTKLESKYARGKSYLLTYSDENRGELNRSRLSAEQIQLLKELLKDFQYAPVYRLLKDEKQYITITEKEFVRFMNQEFGKGWDVSKKRITSFREVTITEELRRRFKSLTKD